AWAGQRTSSCPLQSEREAAPLPGFWPFGHRHPRAVRVAAGEGRAGRCPTLPWRVAPFRGSVGLDVKGLIMRVRGAAVNVPSGAIPGAARASVCRPKPDKLPQGEAPSTERATSLVLRRAVYRSLGEGILSAGPLGNGRFVAHRRRRQIGQQAAPA